MMPLDRLFQSTLPGWGATPDRTVPGFPAGYFNPRSPDGERPPFSTICATESVFQSTLPGWGATHVKRRLDFGRTISIHAPRMGSDSPCTVVARPPRNFNPRSPDGERRRLADIDKAYDVFQSTLPGWGATCPTLWPARRTRHFNPRSPDGERRVVTMSSGQRSMCFVKFLWAVSAFLLVRLSGCF